MATAPNSSLPPPSATRPSTMTASQTPSPVHNPADLYHHSEVTAHALITNTLQTLDQRAPPSLQEILAAFTSKGDGDRDMLFALLNAKAAEDNRIAAERNLRRSLLEMYKGQPVASTSLYMPEGQGYSMPSPPASTYRSSPYPIRRASRSPSSSQSSDDAYLESRKRRRSRSPGHEFRSHRQGSLSAVTRSDAPLPPSPYSSASSQTGSGSPRSREAMNIGSLLAASGERDVRSQAQQVSYVRRDDDSARRHI